MELFILVSFIMIIGCFWQKNNEIRWWNNGICKETGKSWELFDVDSQGGRGYKSDNHHCWISYSIDKYPPN